MKRAISFLLALAMVLALPLGAFAEDDSFGVGASEGNSYWNESLSLGCTLGDEWYFYTDEEIMESVQQTAGQLKDEMAEAIKDGGSFIDMMAMDTGTGTNVNVTLERLSISNALLIGEAQYIRGCSEQLGEALGQLGLENLDMQADEMDFLGQKHPCLRITGTVQGIPFFETMAVVKHGRTIIIVTACSYYEDSTDAVIGCFYTEKP